MNSPTSLPTSPRAVDRFCRWLCAGVTLLLLTWGIVSIDSWFVNSPDVIRRTALTVIYMAAGAVLLGSLAWLWSSTPSRRVMGWIIAAGLLMRLLAFVQPPHHETDFYRYLWEGALTANGYSAYTIRPVDALEQRAGRIPADDAFARLADAAKPTLRQVNHSYLTTIYPPVAQAFFALAYSVRPFSANALRAILLLVDIGTLALLIALLGRLGLPLHWVAIYWWNPIITKELFVSAHMDGLAVIFTLAAVLAAVTRWRYTAIMLLGLAIGAKIWPILLAPIILRYGARCWRSVAVGAVLLAGLSALLLWPLMTSWGRVEETGLNAYAHQWVNNAGLYAMIQWAAQALHNAGPAHWPGPVLLTRCSTAGLLGVWLLILLRRPLPDASAVVRICVLSVAAMFLLSPTQFPWYYAWLLPFLAIGPSRALLAYTALLPLYNLQYDYPWVLWVEHLPVWLLIGWSIWPRQSPTGTGLTSAGPASGAAFALPAGFRVSVIIPALNEEHAIGKVLGDIPRWVCQIIVVDNGSTDRTAEVAREGGAVVIPELRRGYGQACLSGIAALAPCDVVVFLDGDYSDRPGEIAALLAPIVANQADLVIGSRTLGEREAGSLTLQQRFGNALACWLIRVFYRVRFSDLGPFRAIRHTALLGLRMDDTTYGWTVQMQTRAVRMGLRCAETPVSYHRRIGVSKISGTLRGVWGAGTCIIGTIFREAIRKRTAGHRIIVFARYPEPGKTKTRLIPALGAAGAANLHRQMIHIALYGATHAAARTAADMEVRFTGGSAKQMADAFGTTAVYRQQSGGDLGARMHQALAQAFADGVRRALVIGTDCPRLSAEIIASSLEQLADHDLVIGPAEDGGYYLIAMRRPIAPLFAGINWGTSQVRAQTLAVAQTLGLKVHLLAILPDVDTPDDLKDLASQASVDCQTPLWIIIPALNDESRMLRRPPLR